MGQRRRMGSVLVFLTAGWLVLVGTASITAQATGESAVLLAPPAQRGR